MARFQLLAVLVVILVVRVAYAQEPTRFQEAPAGLTCVVYSLHEFGDDADLGKWIADTIPEVIEPSTWSSPRNQDQKHVLRYYAPKKILIVYHTPAVQTKVEAFLKDLKKSVPDAKGKMAAGWQAGRGVVGVDYREPALLRPASVVPDGGYPVPAQPRAPKHLFHFIIRYEGEGVIDDNVAKVIGDQMQKDKKEEKKEEKEGESKTAASSSTPAQYSPPTTEPSRSSTYSSSGAPMLPAGYPNTVPPKASEAVPAPTTAPATPKKDESDSEKPTPAPKKKKKKKSKTED